MKKVMIGLIAVIVIQFVVIAALYRSTNVVNDCSCIHEKELKRLKKTNWLLKTQLFREKARLDDDRNGDSCPLCGNDSIIELLYGYRYLDVDSFNGKKIYASGGCMVSNASKRYVCRKCAYQWGLLKEYQK